MGIDISRGNCAALVRTCMKMKWHLAKCSLKGDVL
jgi:hypothetical protein